MLLYYHKNINTVHQYRPFLMLTALFALASALGLIHGASALQTTFDLTKGNSTIWFGGEKIGKLVLTTNDDLGPGTMVNITVHVNQSPSENKVFEIEKNLQNINGLRNIF